MKVTEDGIIVPINIILQKKGMNLMKNLVVLMTYQNILKRGKNYGRKIIRTS